MPQNKCDKFIDKIFNEFRVTNDTSKDLDFLYVMSKADYHQYQKGSKGKGGGSIFDKFKFNGGFSKEKFEEWKSSFYEKLSTSEKEAQRTTSYERIASPDVLNAYNECMKENKFGASLSHKFGGGNTVFVDLYWAPYPNQSTPPKISDSYIDGAEVVKPLVEGNKLFKEKTPLIISGNISAVIKRTKSETINIQVKISNGEVENLIIPPPPKTSNATRDFPTNFNDEKSIWRYGYRGTLQSDFILFKDQSIGTVLHWWGKKIDQYGDPGITYNGTGYPVEAEYGGVIKHPSTMLNLHPGPNGEFCVLRWTAPIEGDYQIEIYYQGLNIKSGTTSNLVVIHKSYTIIPSINVTGSGPESSGSREVEVTVAQGDTIDFCVGPGSNDYTADSTGLDVRITPVNLD